MAYTIYTKPNCPYCNYAKDFLMNRGESFKEIDITFDMEALTFIKDEMKLKTVPAIFNGDSHLIGGYQELLNHFRDIDEKNFTSSIF